MNKKPAMNDDDDFPRAPPKQRTCLSCGSAFTSVWAGERICTVCKRSTSWRAGSAHKRTEAR
jgi:hypothetical protein